MQSKIRLGVVIISFLSRPSLCRSILGVTEPEIKFKNKPYETKRGPNV